MFSLQQNWRTREQNRFCLEARGSGVGGGREKEEGGVRVERWPKQCIHILINIKAKNKIILKRQ
jgi:hypothetical protein